MSDDTTPAQSIKAHALVLGDRLHLRQLSQVEVLAQNPVMVDVSGGGFAVLFRFGVAVFFDVAPVAQSAFLKQLEHLIRDPVSEDEFERDDLEIRIDPERGDSVEGGILYISDRNTGRLQVAADILAKSVLLSSYEARIGAAFERIEPLAKTLKESGRGARQDRELVRHIGETMLIQHRMVGRAQVGDKPEIIWEHPELERLFLRLEQEYEINERLTNQDRKLEVISSTAETLLELLQNQRSLRVEWYIVILIVMELAISLYQLLFR